MNYKMIGRILSLIFGAEALFMLTALFVSLGYGEGETALAFLYAILISLALSGTLLFLTRKAKLGLNPREGLVTVALSWISMSVVGALPFVMTGAIPRFIDALFEIVSGFTTTGATILSDVEALDRGLLYWRGFSNWIGGMGVLVFVLAVVPLSGKGNGFTMNLLRAESPGPDVGKLVPQMKKSAMILYALYIVLTVLNFVFLLFGDMPVFDAVCTTFSTAGTGGFGTRNASMAEFSPYIQCVTMVFMLLFGINFNCFYLILMRKARLLLKDEELRFYLLVIAFSAVVITFNIRGRFDTVEETVRHAAFQVVSIITSTGFITADFDLWPEFSKAILLMLMVIGACAGSTGGGIKCSRVVLLLKDLRRNVRRITNPQQVQVVRDSGRIVEERVLANTNAYLSVYVCFVVLSVLLLSLDGFSIMTNLSAALTCFNNIGPGLDSVGPIENFSVYSDFSKFILVFDMLAGRLEIFPVLILFSRKTWSW